MSAQPDWPALGRAVYVEIKDTVDSVGCPEGLDYYERDSWHYQRKCRVIGEALKAQYERGASESGAMLRELADADPVVYSEDHGYECALCEGGITEGSRYEPANFKHEPGCLWARAKALMAATKGEGDG